MTNPIEYIGFVQAINEHENRLWSFLPPNFVNELRSVAHAGLIESVLDDYIFNEESKKVLINTFINNFTTFDTFKKLMDTFFDTNEARLPLIDLIRESSIQKIEDLLKQFPEKTLGTLSGACGLIDGIADLYERIFILQDLLVKACGSDRPSAERLISDFRDLCYSLISNPILQFEQCAAKAIGRSIELIVSNPGKNKEELYRIQQLTKILNFSLKKDEFIIYHNAFMMSRCCQYAGSQCVLESDILDRIHHYFPPTLTSLFEDNQKHFDLSAKNNEEWAKENQSLRVFTMEKMYAHGIAPVFPEMREKLPPQFESLLTSYEQFFKKKVLQKDNIECTWVFEDNLMTIDLVFQKCSFQLTTPAIMGLFIFALIEKKGKAKISELADAIGVPTAKGIYLAKRGMSKDFHIFKFMTPVNIQKLTGAEELYFDPDFNCPPKIAVGLSVNYKMILAQPSILVSKIEKLHNKPKDP